jgi:translocation and assembly module TamB
MNPSRSGNPEAGPRARRWIGRAAVVALAAIAVVLLGAVVLLRQLDAPWLKSRLLSLVRSSSGLEVDYRALRIRPLSGLAMEGLVVRTPPALRDLAPELARIGRLDVAWSPASLLGRGPRLQRLTLEDVAVTLVSDEQGRTSLDALSHPAESPRRPPPAHSPLSHAADELLSSAPPVGQLELSGLTLTFVRARGGRVADRFALRGLSLRAETVRDGGAYRLRATAGSPSAPLPLEVTRDGQEVAAAAAKLEASLAAEASPAGAEASLDVRVREQNLAPRVSVRELLRLEASVTFDPACGRTDLSLTRVGAADGAAALEARLEIPDAPEALPVVRQARGDVDLQRLLRLVPAGLSPVRLGRGQIHWRAEDLELGVPGPARGGSLLAEADLADVRLSLPRAALSAASAHLSVRASPGPRGHAELRVGGLRLGSGPERMAAEGLEAKLDGTRAGDGSWSGTARLSLAALDLSGAGTVALRQGRAEARAGALRLVPGEPLSTSGEVELSGEIASFSARAPAAGVVAERVRWDVRMPLAGRAPYAARAEVPVERLRVLGTEGRPFVDGSVRLQARLTEVFPDLDRPMASRGVGDLSVALGALQASLHAAKQADSVGLELNASAPGLVSLGRDGKPGGAPWERMTIALSSSARIEGLLSASPRIEQRTRLRLGQPALGGLFADELSLDLRSSGDAIRHRAEADLRLRALRTAEDAPADQHLALSARLDRRRPSLELRLDADGASAGSLTGSLAFDRDRGAVRCDLDGTLERLGPLARLAAASSRPGARAALSGLELAKLGVSVHADVLGVLSADPDGGVPRPAANPLRTAGAAGTVEVRANGLSWREAGRALDVPSARWRATLRAEGTRRTLESLAEVGELHLVSGEHRLDAAGLVQHLSASMTGHLTAGEAEVEQRLEVASLRQDLAAYPVENARFTLRARRDRDGVVHVPELRLENAVAGTTVAAKGIVDAGGFRRRLSLQGQLEQDLARVWSAPATFTGSGRVSVVLRVESPDLAVFRTTSAVRFEDVHARLPEAGIAIEALEGEVPVSANLAIRAKRVTLLHESEVNPYPTLRFADQHPLMSHASFLSIGSIATPLLSVAPLAGNLKVEQNVVSLSQVEMGVRSGKVTGSCVVDWNGARTTLEARVRATGVLSSEGEPFDGNAALVVSAADRSVEGRAEILRIGKRHLLDLLDLGDPHRASAAANRVRHALAFGYPDRVRITFDHGFASARVTLGGLASLIHLDELRGIPMGPLVDKVLAPLSAQEREP